MLFGFGKTESQERALALINWRQSRFDISRRSQAFAIVHSRRTVVVEIR
jgi:hypothetical protein